MTTRIKNKSFKLPFFDETILSKKFFLFLLVEIFPTVKGASITVCSSRWRNVFQRRILPSLKYIIVGDYAVGKTSLCNVFAENRFQKDYKPTIGVAILTKTIRVLPNMEVKLQIWDLAGQQRFFEVMVDYYKGAKGGAVVFDITRVDSFESVDDWVETVRKHSGDIPLILVGNKIDLEDLRSVEYEEAVKKAVSLNLIGYIETSAKLNKNVEDVFVKPIREYLNRVLPNKK